jgi:hypothetical protein
VKIKGGTMKSLQKMKYIALSVLAILIIFVFFYSYATASVNTFILKNLLDFYIIPAVSSPDSLPPNEKEQARLDALANSVARAIGFTWTSENEGMAKDQTS